MPIVAHLAVDIDVGQEVHLDGAHACAFAVLAASAADVEREASGFVAAYAGAGQLREELAYLVEHADVGGGVAARGASDGRLVDFDDFVDVVDAVYRAVG